MFTIEILSDAPKKSERPASETPKGHQFNTRKSARHWCRQNYHRLDHQGLVIVHPDGTKETFEYNGVLQPGHGAESL